MKRPARGFQLAILVLVLLVSGFVALVIVRNRSAIAVRNTFNRLRVISCAMESYAHERGRYPSGKTIDEIAAFLEPDHLEQVPRTDGWSRRFNVESRPFTYTIWSNGSDNIQDPVWIGAVGRDHDGPLDPTIDNAVRDGDFVQYHWGPLAGWSSVAMTARAQGLKHSEKAGMLWVELYRGPDLGSVRGSCYPPPKTELVDLENHVALAGITRPSPVKFVTEEGTYRLRLTLSSGQTVLTREVLVIADAVSVEKVAARWECVTVALAKNQAATNGPMMVQAVQHGVVVAEEAVEAGNADFQLIPGDYEFIMTSGDRDIACASTTVESDARVTLEPCAQQTRIGERWEAKVPSLDDNVPGASRCCFRRLG